MKLKLCATIVGILTSFSTLAAPPPRPVGKWCKADQEKLCPGMEWGTGLAKCLNKNAAQVSDLCKQHHPKMFSATPPPATAN